VRKPRFVPPLLCLGIAGVFLWVGARWILDRRVGGLLDVDESSYFSMAIVDYIELSRNGILPWLTSIAGRIHAPLTTTVATLVYAATGPELHYGFFIPLTFGAVTVLAVYLLVAAISGPYAGLSAAALTATIPLLISYSRHFHFAVPATAMLALALLAAVKSERFSRTGWSLAFGVFLGLVPLARTMAIAFIPGVLLGAVLGIAASDGVARRLLRLAGGLALALLTAATWLAFAFEGVAGYLIGWGYGARALDYGQAVMLFSMATVQRALSLVTTALFLPHYAVILAGLAAGLVVVLRAWRQQGFGAIRAAARSPLLMLALTVLCGLTALVSSPNTGTAFVLPLLPPLIALAVCLAWSASSAWVFRAAVFIVCMSVAAGVAAPYFDTHTIQEKVSVVPVIGFIPIYSTKGQIDVYIDSSSAKDGRDKAVAARWLGLIGRINAAISRQADGAATAVGFKHDILNPSALGFDYLLTTQRQREFTPPDPVASGNTVQGYRDWLTAGAAKHVVFVLTSRGTEGEYAPFVDVEAVEQAARELGFQAIDTWSMPNGRPVTLWRRSGARG